MRWSQMSTQERAKLTAGARYAKDTIATGKVARLGKPLSEAAEILKASRLRDQDLDRAKEVQGQELMFEALREFRGAVVQCPTGRAYGSNELTRQRRHALPMQFYRHGGGC